MGHLKIIWQCIRVHNETMILAGNFYAAGGQILHRMVCAAMATIHLVRLCPHRQRHQLVADTNAKDWHAGIDKRTDFGCCIAA